MIKSLKELQSTVNKRWAEELKSINKDDAGMAMFNVCTEELEKKP